MIDLTLAQIAEIVGGELADISAADAASTRVTGSVEFDSRAVTSGCLFIALPGARSDGHDFAAGAVAAGAAGVLAARPVGVPAVVVAPRTEAGTDTAASVLVLAPDDLATTAALTLDDALRQVPGFTLFRRSGSRTANPTSQGVSLRGVGASGASRAVTQRSSSA